MRAQAAGTRLTLDWLALPCRSSPGLGAAGMPEVSRGPAPGAGDVPPADAGPTSGRGPGTEEERALGSRDNFGGCLCWAVSRGLRSEWLERGAGSGRRSGCQLLPGGRHQPRRPQRRELSWSPSAGMGWKLVGSRGKPPGSPQAPGGRACLPWERAPSGWAAGSGRSAAGAGGAPRPLRARSGSGGRRSPPGAPPPPALLGGGSRPPRPSRPENARSRPSALSGDPAGGRRSLTAAWGSGEKRRGLAAWRVDLKRRSRAVRTFWGEAGEEQSGAGGGGRPGTVRIWAGAPRFSGNLLILRAGERLV